MASGTPEIKEPSILELMDLTGEPKWLKSNHWYAKHLRQLKRWRKEQEKVNNLL